MIEWLYYIDQLNENKNPFSCLKTGNVILWFFLLTSEQKDQNGCRQNFTLYEGYFDFLN